MIKNGYSKNLIQNQKKKKNKIKRCFAALAKTKHKKNPGRNRECIFKD